MDETEQKQATPAPQTINLQSQSLNDLKALAYDRILIIEKAQLELQKIQLAINQKEGQA